MPLRKDDTVVYHFACPKCGASVPTTLRAHDPAYLPADHPEHGDVHPERVALVCADENEHEFNRANRLSPICGHRFVVTRDARGRYAYEDPDAESPAREV